MAFPVTANTLAGLLPKVQTVSADSLPLLDSLIVIDGDNRLGRARTAFEVYKTASPRTIRLLGDGLMRNLLVEAGIPSDEIVIDSTPLNTRHQMAAVSELVGKDHWRSALVASRLQAPRIAALAEAAGFPVRIVASPADREPAATGPRVAVPSFGALMLTRDSIYEHVALAYYRWQGWTRGRSN